MNYDESDKPVDAFVVGPDPCVYFPERIAHAIVVDSDEDIKPTVYAAVLRDGAWVPLDLVAARQIAS